MCAALVTWMGLLSIPGIDNVYDADERQWQSQIQKNSIRICSMDCRISDALDADQPGDEENGDPGSQDWWSMEDEDTFRQLDDIMSERSDITFSDIYDALRSGSVDEAWRQAVQVLMDRLVYEFRTSKALALQIAAVIILGSAFSHVSGNMGEYVMENGFMVSYMVLVSLLLGDFVIVQSVVADTIGDVVDFMKAFYPMYAASMMCVSGPESSRYSQSIIIFVIYICQNIMIGAVIPLVKCSGLLSLVNNLNREDHFSKMAQLMKSISVWGMRSVFAVVTGINVVKSIIAPSLDRVSRNGVLKTIGRMSGMSTVSSVLSVMISTGEFIKNCMGMACTIVIIIMAAVPVLKILVVIFTLKCIAALVQPIGDRRYADGVGIVAETSELMLKACGISVMMFVISIALMTMNIS